MGQKGTEFASDLLKLIFQNMGIRGLAEPCRPAGSLYISLHTDDPGPGGNQTTNEAQYAGYGRVEIERSPNGWTVVGNTVSPAMLYAFPKGRAGGELCTYAAIGTDPSGPGRILYRGKLTPSITTGNGITPEIPPSSTITES
jgi:hypothetical protein